MKQPTLYGEVREVGVKVLRECALLDTLCDTPAKIDTFWREHIVSAPWYDDGREQFVVFFLNTRRRIQGFQLVAVGCLDAVSVSPSHCYRAAIVQNAAAIVFAHNHPSGDPTPSEADVKVTRDLIRAGQLLKLDLLDHLVIGRTSAELPDGYRSLRELGYFYS